MRLIVSAFALIVVLVGFNAPGKVLIAAIPALIGFIASAINQSSNPWTAIVAGAVGMLPFCAFGFVILALYWRFEFSAMLVAILIGSLGGLAQLALSGLVDSIQK